MRMAEQRRRWFQLSLTTCIVLMVVAGVLMYLNLCWHAPIELPDPNSELSKVGERLITVRAAGWPLACYWYCIPAATGEDHFPIYELRRLAWNLTTLVAILFSISFGCEFLIRRSQRKHQDPQQ